MTMEPQPRDARLSAEGVGGPWTFGSSTLEVGDEAVYSGGHGWAQRATVTDKTEGRMHYLSGDVGGGCWHSELHSPAEFLARGRAGALGSAVQRAIEQGGDLDDIIGRLEPACWPDGNNPEITRWIESQQE